MKVKAALIGLGLLIATYLALPVATHFYSKTEVSVEVTGKERINDENGSRYMVFTKTEVFTNQDSWIALKFNSSDVYSQIPNTGPCTFTVTGYRIKLLSAYRNILKVTC